MAGEYYALQSPEQRGFSIFLRLAVGVLAEGSVHVGVVVERAGRGDHRGTGHSAGRKVHSAGRKVHSV